MEKNSLLNVEAGDPRFCDIVIATRCILRCKMCKAWQSGSQSKEITFEEAKRFVKSLSEFVKYPLEINVMGGEPFLKDWCLDLCSFISQQGFKSIISTNAYLIDEDMAKKIAWSKLNVLAISLESLKAKTHDFYRGVEGVFSKVMNAIEHLDKHCRGHLAVTILTIIMEKNLDDILELVEWVNSNGLFVNISFLALLETGLVHPRHNWFKRPEYSEIWPQDTNKTRRLIDELIRLKKKGYKIWNPISQMEAFKEYYIDPDKFMQETEYRVHDYIIDLDENGTIYLSGEPLGNIKEDDLKQLWSSEKANQIRNKIDTHGPGKRCCVINFVCAFPEDGEYLRSEYMQNEQEHQNLGFRYFKQGQIEKAIDEFNQSLRLNPKSENAHNGLALCYQYNKQFDKAVNELLQGLKINPDNEHIHQNLGFCYKDLKQFDKAIDEFGRVLEINPNNEQGYLGFGFCYFDQGQIEKAAEQFNHVLELNPKNEHAHHGLGLCYQYNKQFDKAIDEFGLVLEIDNSSEYGHEGLGRCYEGLREFYKAVDEFRQVLKINPNNEHVLRSLASCYEGLQQQGNTMYMLENTIGINQKDAHIHYSLGLYYLLKRKDFSKAIDEFNQVLEIEPHNIKCLLEKTGVYFRQKKYKEASGILHEVLKLDPANQEALKYLKEIERPDLCVIEVSHKCMFQCKICNYWKTKSDPEEVDIEALRKFVSSLKNFVNTPFEINISGGEPLLKKGILGLVEFISKQGFKFSLVTNGYLINKTVAKRIADSGLNFIAISLDSLDEYTHDCLRGVKGANKKVMESIEYLTEYRGKLENITIQAIIMGPNLDGILDIANWAQQKRISVSFMAITQPNMAPIDPAWYKKEEFNFLWPKDIPKVQFILDNLIKLKNNGYRIDNPIGQLQRFKLYFSDPERFVRETPCSLGDDIIHINPKGDIYLCCQMQSVGNIKEGDISAIWDSEKAQGIREKMRLCKRNCAGMVNCYREGA